MNLKSDRPFEKAATDETERAALLQKMRRKRNLAFRGGIVGLCLAFVLVLVSMLIVAGDTLKYEGLLEGIMKTLRILIPASVGLIIGTVVLDQYVKMLILAGAQTAEPSANPSHKDPSDHGSD